jgi:hypothetical protein
VSNQGYGSTAQFEQQFESTCALLDTNRLPLFGIACVDDRERLGENVYGAGGLIEFLQRRRAEGRLAALLLVAAAAGCASRDPWEGARIESEVKARLVAQKDADLTRLGVMSPRGSLISAARWARRSKKARPLPSQGT